MPTDFAPAPFQKIFKLEKFLPNYSEDPLDRNIVAWPDGSLGLRKNSRKISSPSSWMVAANGLGRYLAHLSASHKETEFKTSLVIGQLLFKGSPLPSKNRSPRQDPSLPARRYSHLQKL
jgi:hypothetical protein